MNVKEVKDKITVLIGGKPAKELPVGIGEDGVVATKPSRTELPGDGFRKKVLDLNKHEAELREVKEKAERMIHLACTKEARERAELDGKDQPKIIAGLREEVKTADRALQRLKDDRFNLFSVERERIGAIQHAAWLIIHADLIEPLLNSQITDALIDAVVSEKSEAHQEMIRIDMEIDSFNTLAKDNGIPSNLHVPIAEKMLGRYELQARQASDLDLRRRQKANNKIHSAFDTRASQALARAKELERHQRSAGWIPGK
jgi:hypothetical protein